MRKRLTVKITTVRRQTIVVPLSRSTSVSPREPERERDAPLIPANRSNAPNTHPEETES
jgi:hypothetical protein